MNERDECGPAILKCEHGCGMTVHIYIGLKMGNPSAGHPEFYECTKCKGRRKWGLLSDGFKLSRLGVHPGIVV